jgi:hypothetical protein
VPVSPKGPAPSRRKGWPCHRAQRRNRVLDPRPERRHLTSLRCVRAHGRRFGGAWALYALAGRRSITSGRLAAPPRDMLRQLEERIRDLPSELFAPDASVGSYLCARDRHARIGAARPAGWSGRDPRVPDRAGRSRGWSRLCISARSSSSPGPMGRSCGGTPTPTARCCSSSVITDDTSATSRARTAPDNPVMPLGSANPKPGHAETMPGCCNR